MNRESSLIKKLTPESSKLQEIIDKHKKEYREVLGSLVASPEDMITLENMALEAAVGSPEMQEALKQVLIERNEERKALHKDLAIDKEGKLVKRSDVLSGEEQ